MPITATTRISESVKTSLRSFVWFIANVNLPRHFLTNEDKHFMH